MKLTRTIYTLYALVICFILVSWGVVGHRTVALIAEKHLTPQAKETVTRFLGNESMSDFSTWADEVRSQSEYRNTAPWHFLNLPLGLNHEEFDTAVKGQSGENIYNAILKNEELFTAANSTKEQRTVALKFLIHLVGDAHQPMHISRKEDKGGNTIQVQFNGKGTNLHSLWDSKLIDRQGLTDAEMAKQYDTATSKDIKRWQKDDVLQWLWESYKISSQLYSEFEKNNKLDDNYYNDHIGIVKQRVDMAGVRLAGLLNNLSKSLQLKPEVYINATYTPLIKLEDVSKQIGNSVSVQGSVYGTKDMGSMVLVNLGAAYPNQLLTVVLRGEAKSLAQNLEGKTVRVTGKVEDYRGKPQIVVTDPKNVEVSK